MAAVGTVLKLAVRNAPKIIAAVGTVSVFLKNNPEISAKVRGTLESIPNRFAAVQQKRGDAAKIRGTLGIVRDVATDLDAHGRSGSGIVAADWIAKADTIEHRVRLAEAQPPAQQKKTMAGLSTEAQTLLADFIDATAHPQPSQASEPPEAELPAS